MLCIFVELVYAGLAPTTPFTGRDAVFSYKSVGYWPALLWVSQLKVIALEARFKTLFISFLHHQAKKIQKLRIGGAKKHKNGSFSLK